MQSSRIKAVVRLASVVAFERRAIADFLYFWPLRNLHSLLILLALNFVKLESGVDAAGVNVRCEALHDYIVCVACLGGAVDSSKV